MDYKVKFSQEAYGTELVQVTNVNVPREAMNQIINLTVDQTTKKYNYALGLELAALLATLGLGKFDEWQAVIDEAHKFSVDFMVTEMERIRLIEGFEVEYAMQRNIDMIKLLRSYTSAGLKEAKDGYEAWKTWARKEYEY